MKWNFFAVCSLGAFILQSTIAHSKPQFAYVADQNGHVYQCALDADGQFKSCLASLSKNKTSKDWSPFDVAFATVNKTPYAYIADASNGVAYQCTLNADGTFKDCSATPSNALPWDPNSVAITTVNNKQYAYVADSNGHVYQCTLKSNGTFETCLPTKPKNVPIWNPVSVAFSTPSETQYAYVATRNNNTLYQCNLDSVDGTLQLCTPTPSDHALPWTPVDVAFAKVNKKQYAYVASLYNHSVYRCALNYANGALKDCLATPSTSPPAWSPAGVAFATVNEVQYAYVTTTGNSNGVFQCSLNSVDGTFDTCSDMSFPDEISWYWSPFGIIFY